MQTLSTSLPIKTVTCKYCKLTVEKGLRSSRYVCTECLTERHDPYRTYPCSNSPVCKNQIERKNIKPTSKCYPCQLKVNNKYYKDYKRKKR